MKNILYYDTETKTVKTSQHVAFDEVMHDLTDKPPNAHLLDGVHCDAPDLLDFDLDYPDLDVSLQPFTTFDTVTIPLDLAAVSPLGLDISTCSHLQCTFILAIHCPAIGHTLHAFCHKYLGSYLVSMNGHPVYSPSDVDAILTHLGRVSPQLDMVELVLAPECAADFDDYPSPLHLCLNDLCHVCALQSISGEGYSTTEFCTALDAFSSDLTDSEMTMVIHHLQTSDMTNEEYQLSKFTWHNLQYLSNWPLWDAAFNQQLNDHHAAGTFGHPVPTLPPVLMVHGLISCVLTGITSSSPMALRSVTSALMAQSVLPPGCINLLRHMPLALNNHACACSSPLPLPKVLLCPLPTPRMPSNNCHH